MLISSLALLVAAAWSGAEPNNGCPAGTVFVEERRTETAEAIYVQPVCRLIQRPRGLLTSRGGYHPYAAGFRAEGDFVRAMVAYADKLAWRGDEIDRVTRSLATLGRTDTPQATDAEIAALWGQMKTRSSDTNLVAAAARSRGAASFRSGWQSGRYSDCAIFALSTATGAPYGVVAARAAELLRSAEWRIESDRKAPERVFNLAGGLNGGEVILLGEALGRVSILQLSQIPTVLEGGKPVMISLSTSSGGAHQVTLSRTFRHGDTDWYEVINSQAPDVKLSQFLTHAELQILADEKGILVEPEPGSVLTPLRD